MADLDVQTIIERAKEEFDVKLDEQEAEIIREDVQRITDISNKSGRNVASTPRLIGSRIEKVIQAKEFADDFYLAERLFRQCSPDGDFYVMPKGSQDIIGYLERGNIARFDMLLESAAKFAGKDESIQGRDIKTGFIRDLKYITGRLQLLINKFGSPVVGKKVFYMHGKKEEKKVIESTITGVNKTGYVLIKDRKGHARPRDVFCTLEKVEEEKEKLEQLLKDE